MPFLFEFKLNDSEITGIETGFSHSRKWEEALDEAKFSLPFYDSVTPLPQYGLLQIKIVEVDNYTDLNELDEETLDMLIISDDVKITSQYGIWRHNIITVEYTGKLDAYIMASLARTRDIISDVPAKFEITASGQDFNSFSEIAANNGEYTANVFLPPFSPNEKYYSNTVYTFSQVEQAYQVIADSGDGGYGHPYQRVPTIFRIYNVTTDTYSSWYVLSAADVDITFTTVGKYWIEYGLFSTTWQTSLSSQGYTAQEYAVIRFFIDVIDENQQTMYDVVNSVRQNVSKGGGIESEYYFDDTRIFDIDSNFETYLKSIQVPQMYLGHATARQMLIYALSYINSLPRLEYGSGLDTLTLEQFNLSNGDYTEENIFDKSGNQNTNQIGTRSYSPLNQVLPNNMDEPTTYAPSQDGLMQVRADNLQVTDSSFTIKLQKEIYTPKEFYVNLDNIGIQASREDEVGTPVTDNDFTYNVEIPLISRFINIEEWKLKVVTDNFPSITTKKFWDYDVGLRQNMVENLYWELNAKKIHVSDVYGQLVQRTVFQNVIKLAIIEYLMLNMFTPFTYTYAGSDYIYKKHVISFSLDFLTDISAYKDLRFRVSYLSMENLVIKEDKEDLTQIDFYSEMRHNQDESIINAVRASRKIYGDLQRTGNKSFSFPKIHHSLSEAYGIGKKDVNDYTITRIDRTFYAEFFIADYGVTKFHNRDSRQSIVDQTYRWRDNYAKSVLDREEHYSDYIMIYPPSESGTPQQTKISSVNTIKKMFQHILGETITDFQTRASAAIVRTDGMFEVEEEELGAVYGILTTVSAHSKKNGLAFTLGFDSNQVAGDGLIQRGSNWYNQAVRYTNEQARFSRFGFYILPTYALDTDDYETYPKITRETFEELVPSDSVYFRCGELLRNSAGEDALVVDKDPLTNFKTTYQVPFVSYNIKQYVFGQAFFDDNFLVNNPNGQYPAYLYLYEDGTEYELFVDLTIKSGYATTVTLNNTTIEWEDYPIQIVFTSAVDLTNVTSWAIGNADGKLLIACNEGLNGFKPVDKHFRSGVKEIGNKVIYTIPGVDIVIDIDTDIVVTSHKVDLFEDVSIAIVTDVEVESHLEYQLHDDIVIGTIVGIALSSHLARSFIETVDFETLVDVSVASHVARTFHDSPVIGINVEVAQEANQTKFDNVQASMEVNISVVSGIRHTYMSDAITINVLVDSVVQGGLPSWVSATESEYNSATYKYQTYYDITPAAPTDVSGYEYGAVMAVVTYNLTTTSETFYNGATTKLPTTNSTQPSTGEGAEVILLRDYPSNFADFNGDNGYANLWTFLTVMRIFGESTYTYWREDYTISYYKVE